jgi:cellulase/cellobiase CelA1
VAAAAVVLPGSYFGVSAALEHLGGGGEAVASSAGCQVGCGASPVAASSPVGSASPARTTPAPARSPRTLATHARTAQARPARASGPRPTATPHPTATASPPPPAPPPVTAGYQEQSQWPGGFMDEFTVVNHGSAPVSSWQLKITLPGDMVTGVFGGNWSQDGDVVTLQPYPGQGPLGPGATQTITITANGSVAKPSACTVNGYACS